MTLGGKGGEIIMYDYLKCPNCNSDYHELRLCVNVFLPFDIDASGRPCSLDLSRMTQQDIIENIEENGTEEYRCRCCGSVFKAIQKDNDFAFEVDDEI